MELTNQNREDLKWSMTAEEYGDLIVKTLPELNTSQFNIDIPTLAKMVAVHMFVNEDLFSSLFSFEIAQIEIITKEILRNLSKDGVHGLL